MSFRVTHSGTRALKRKMEALARRGYLREVAGEINRRHAAAMRRRRIPYDTGRLEASLTQTSSPDRRVTVTDNSIEIATLVPYAQYQRQRIRRLTTQERREIFVKPIELAFENTWRRA